MTELLQNEFTKFGLSKHGAFLASSLIVVLIMVATSIVLYVLTRKVFVKIWRKLAKGSRNKWHQSLLRNNVPERASHIVPPLVAFAFSSMLPEWKDWIQRLAFSYIIAVVLVLLDKLLDTADDIYSTYDISRTRPIKGYLQVAKIIFYIFGGILIISVLIDRSPLILLSGIGAATAVLLLVFQNSILGFVASVQLTENDMIRIGDWVEIPKFGADGEVIEVSLHTVKIQNWDKSITTVPPYSLVSESFKNWRGMEESGGRRIKRAIYIDMTSIKFCDEAMLAKYKKINYISQYIEDKTKEIDEYNRNNQIQPDTTAVNGRNLTNIGTFRAYIQAYLVHHAGLNKNMACMVRQLSPTEDGLPIEIYAFTKGTAWANYESIQSDIFDHILAIVPEFDLRIFQRPTGHDMTAYLR